MAGPLERASATFLQLTPDEVVIRDVALSQVYKQTVRVTNTLRSTVEATIKPGSAERWTVSPSSFKLKPGDSTDVELRLKVIKFAARQKAQQQGQRDLFHVKSPYFDQKFYATFFLAADPAPEPSARATSSRQEPLLQAQPSSSGGSDDPSARVPASQATATFGLSSGTRPTVSFLTQAPSTRATLADVSRLMTESVSEEPSEDDDDDDVTQSLRMPPPAVTTGPMMQQTATATARSVRFAGFEPASTTAAAARATLLAAPSPAALFGSRPPPPPAQQTQTAFPGSAATTMDAPSLFRPSMTATQQQEELRLEALEAQLREHVATQAGLRTTIAAQQAQLEQRSSDVARLADQLEQAQRRQREEEEEASAAAAAAAGDDDFLRAENQSLATTNAQLAEQVADFQSQLARSVAEARSLGVLVAELQAGRPDVDEVVRAVTQRQEAVQEERNRKALELLLRKDGVISGQAAEIEKLRKAAEAAEGRGRDAEARLSRQLQEAADKLRARETQLASADERLLSLEAQIEVLRLQSGRSAAAASQGAASASAEQAQQLEQRVRELSGQLAEAERRVRDAEKQVAASAAGSFENSLQRMELQRMQDAIAERDRQLAEMSAELVAALAARSNGSGASTSATPQQESAAVQALQSKLVATDLALRASEERLVATESQLAVARETISSFDRRTAELRSALEQAQREAAAYAQEADSAKAASARLNVRINELALGEQVALAEAGMLKGELGKLQAASRQQQQQQQAMTVAPAAGGGSAGGDSPVRQRDSGVSTTASGAPSASTSAAPSPRKSNGGGSGGYAPRSGFAPASSGSTAAAVVVDADGRAAALERAVEEAEFAVAVIQEQLLEAIRAKQAAEAQVAAVKSEADAEVGRLQAEVRMARQEQSLKVATLEEAVQKLGGRGDLMMEAARLSSENSGLKRLEARLTAELQHADARLRAIDAQAAELRGQLAEKDGLLAELYVYSLSPPIESANGALVSGPAAVLAPAPKLAKRLGATTSTAAERGAVSATALPGKPQPGSKMEREQLDLKAVLKRQSEELIRRQQLIARLVARAEAAEADAAALQKQVDRDDALIHAPLPPLNRAKASQAEVMQYAHLELQRRLAVKEAELRALRERSELADVQVSRLQMQLQEAARTASAAAAQLEAAEKALAEQAAGERRRASGTTASASQEVAALRKQAAEASRSAQEAVAGRATAEKELQDASASLSKLTSDFEAKHEEMRRSLRTAQRDAQQAHEAAGLLRREAEAALAEADERKMQITVLMETIETLQAGNPGEKEQRVVSLTALLAAAKGREAALEARATELLSRMEAQLRDVGDLQGDLAAARGELAAATTEASRLKATLDVCNKELSDAKAQVKVNVATAAKTARQLDEAAQKVVVLESELAGLRAALDEAHSRNAEQLEKEREEAAATARRLQSQLAVAAPKAAGLGAAVAFRSRLERGLDELILMVQRTLAATSRAQQQQQQPLGGATSTTAATTATAAPSATADAAPGSHQQPLAAEDASWAVAVMQQLKRLLLQVEGDQLQHAADAHIARQAAAAASARAASLQLTLEQVSGELSAAQVSKQLLERALRGKMALAVEHTAELVALQTEQVEALGQQLQQQALELIACRAAAAGASAALSAETSRREALQRQVDVVRAEASELAARLAAAQMFDSEGEAARQHEDRIRSYFQAEVSKILMRPDHKDRVLSLTREICALKLSEAQLTASLAAAKRSGDAATSLAASLNQAVRAAEDKVAKLQEAAAAAAAPNAHPPSSTPSATSTFALGASSTTGSSSGRLFGGAATATLGAFGGGSGDPAVLLQAKVHEVSKLKTEALKARQALEVSEQQAGELGAQLSATQLMLQQARDDAATALVRLREQAAAEMARERLNLQMELAAAQAEAAEAGDNLAQARLMMEAEADARVQEAVGQALKGMVRSGLVQEAEARAVAAEAQAAACNADRGRLQQHIADLEAKARELEADRQVTQAAVAGLEETLAKIERAAVAAAASAQPGGGAAAASSALRALSPLAGGARRVPTSAAATPGSAGGGGLFATATSTGRSAAATGSDGDHTPHAAGSGGDVSIPGLSRQLVQAKLAEAAAAKRLAVQAATLSDMQKKLTDRDARISQLKETISALQSSNDELRRKAGEAERVRGRPIHLSRSVSPSSSRPGAAAATSRGSAVTSSGRTAASSAAAAAATGSSRPGSRQQQQQQQQTQLLSPRLGSTVRLLAADADFLESPGDALASTSRVNSQAMTTTRGGAASADAEVAAGQAEYLAAQIAQLRMALLAKEAEVEMLQQQRGLLPGGVTAPERMRQAEVAQRAEAADRLQKQLAEATAELAAALAVANALLSGLGAAPVAASAGGGTKSSLDPSTLPSTLSTAMSRLAAKVQPLMTSSAGTATGGRAALAAAGTPPSAAATAAGASRDEVESLTAQLAALRGEHEALSAEKEWLSVELGGSQAASKAAREKLALVEGQLRAMQQQEAKAPGTTGMSALLVEKEWLETQLADCQGQLQASQARISGLELQLRRQREAASALGGDAAAAGVARPPPDPAPTAATTAAAAPSGDAATPAHVQQKFNTLCDELRALQADKARLSHDNATLAQLVQGAAEKTRALEAQVAKLKQDAATARLAAPAAAKVAAATAAAPPAAAARTRPASAKPNVTFASPPDAGSPSATQPASSWQTVGSTDQHHHHGDASSEGEAESSASPSASFSFGGAAAATAAATAQKQQQRRESRERSAARAAAASAAVTVLQAELAEAKAKAEKHKSAAQKLSKELSLLKASVTAREAAFSERLTAAEKAGEQQVAHLRAQLQRHESKQSGFEAARRELLADADADRAASARLAEASARAASLERQLETSRATAEHTVAGLQEEVSSLKLALAQEQSERARVVVSLHDSLANMKAIGDKEGKLRTELVNLHERLAKAEAASEQADARVSMCKLVIKRLRKRVGEVDALAGRLAAAEGRVDHVAAALGGRLEGLAGRLAAMPQELDSLLGTANTLDAAFRSLEGRMAEVDAALKLAARMADRQKEAEYVATVSRLRAELDAGRKGWESDRALLQVQVQDLEAANQGLHMELSAAQTRVIAVTEAQQQEAAKIVARHVAHMADTQARIDEERRAMEAEAAARAEAAAADAAAGASQRFASVEHQYLTQVSNAQQAAARLQSELRSLAAEFAAYQKQKSREVADLEEQLASLVAGAGVEQLKGWRSRQQRGGAKAAIASGGTAGAAGRGLSYGGSGNDRFVGSGRRGSAARDDVESLDDQLLLRRSSSPGASTLGGGGGGGGDDDDVTSATGGGSSGLRGGGGNRLSGRRIRVRGLRKRVVIPSWEQLSRQAADLAATSSGGPFPGSSAVGGGSGAAPDEGTAMVAAAVAASPWVAAVRVREAERVAAVQREARLERLARTRLESLNAKLRVTVSRLEAQLRVAARQIQAAKDAPSPSLIVLQGELNSTKDALRRAQQELKRHKAAAQAAAAASSTLASASVEVAAQKAGREAAEAKLRDMRVTVERKNVLIKDLRGRVEELQAAAASVDMAGLAAKLADAEGRAKQLTAALARRDQQLRELKERLDSASVGGVSAGGLSPAGSTPGQSQHTPSTGGAASASAAVEDAERQGRLLQKLKVEVARKEAQLASLHAELSKGVAQAEVALKAAEESGAKRSDRARRLVSDLAAALQTLARLVLRCGRVMRAATALHGRALPSGSSGASATTGSSSIAARSASGGAATTTTTASASGSDALLTMGAIAELTELTVDEVADLLQAAQGGGGGQDDDSSAAAEASRLMQQLDALLASSLSSGALEAGGASTSSGGGGADLPPGGAMARVAGQLVRTLQLEVEKAEALLMGDQRAA